MKLKIKKEFLNNKMSSPIDGNLITLRFLEPELYIHWYNRYHQYLFDVIIEEEIKKED